MQIEFDLLGMEKMFTDMKRTMKINKVLLLIVFFVGLMHIDSMFKQKIMTSIMQLL